MVNAFAISGEVDPTDTPFLGSGQDNSNFWYIQLVVHIVQGQSLVSVAQYHLLRLLNFGPAGDLKAGNGDILQDTILTVQW